MQQKIPKKLKDDSIIETICEVRFESPEPPEIVIGRLTDCDPWNSFDVNRLPAANIPEPIRKTDQNLWYQPDIELVAEGNLQRVRVGGRVISFHMSGAYCGWGQYQPQLNYLFECLFSKLKKVDVHRIGFRYVNALTSSKHKVSSYNDLNMHVMVGGEHVVDDMFMNFRIKNDDTHFTMTRIATPQYIQGNLPLETKVIVDIDVSTPDGFKVNDVSSAMGWVNDAHTFEKYAYFRLFHKEMLDELVEEW